MFLLKKIYPGILLFVASALISLTGLSQPGKYVTDGLEYFEKGDYLKALDNFDKALDSIASLQPGDIATAYFFRGQASVKLLFKATLDDDQNTIALYRNALFDAFTDYKNALEYDDGVYKYKILKALDSLYEPLLQSGMAQLNAVYDGFYPPADEDGALLYAGQCLITALQIKEDYVAYDLLGQVNLELQDTVKAYTFFVKAANLFEEKGAATPDLLAGYIFYRLAYIDAFVRNDPELALENISRGEEGVNMEYEKINRAAMPQGQRNDYEQLYSKISSDLENLKRDVYLDNPGLSNKGIEDIAGRLNGSPGDYANLIALASLLEKNNVDSAIAVYKKAIEVNPTHEVAWYNLGVLYYNRGIKFTLKAKQNISTDSTLYYNKKAQLEFETALPLLQKAFEINPNSRETVHALKQICLYTARYDDFNMYDGIEKKLRNKR